MPTLTELSKRVESPSSRKSISSTPHLHTQHANIVSATLVLGTHNKKKGFELAVLFEPLGFALRTLADFPEAIEVVEDGDSFTANARLKASQQARHLGQWTLGEDSGLVVDALDGAPGIYSARYSGEDATDQSNNDHLLAELAKLEDAARPKSKKKTPSSRRAAHYVCHMALANPAGEILAESEDICRGTIRHTPVGDAGFGYDPLFEIAEYHQTFGQLGDAVKRILSHRSRAARAFVPQLAALICEGEWVST